jgi:hypothetical protein
MLARCSAAFAAYALAATSALGYPPDYGPFAPGEKPPPFSLLSCPLLAADGPDVVVGRHAMTYGDGATAGPRLRATAADFFSGIEVEVLDAQGRSLAGPDYVSDFPPHSRPDAAFCADINGDGLLDFVLPLASRGNSLGALFHDLVIVLSSGPSHYRIWVVPTAAPGAEDFLRLPADISCVIVKSSFRSDDQKPESKRHSYWIYNLVAVRNDELVVANRLDRRFPKWVWYTDQPNHKPTASLSAADKARIWGLQQESMFWEASHGRAPR